MKNQKILFVCNKNEHPVHLGFAEAIGADIYERSNYISNILKIPKYDVFLITNPTDISLKKTLYQNTKIIQLIASQFYIRYSYGLPKPLTKVQKILSTYSLRYIDGAIAISTFVRDAAANVLKCPIKISYPFINDKKYYKLLKINPDLSSKKIFFVGTNRPNLNIDMLVKAFMIAQREIPKLELFIVGQGHHKGLNHINGIHVTGWVDDIIPYIEDSSLAVFPGYGQSFYLGVVETMLAGVPTLVTEYTGAKDVVNHESFIRKPTPEKIAEGIIWYFGLSNNEKREYSSIMRGNAMVFDKTTKCNEFKKNFEEILREVWKIIRENIEITNDVIKRVEQVIKLLENKDVGVTSGINPSETSRFLAMMEATTLLRPNEAQGIFTNPLVREYCLSGKLPKRCFEKL